MAGVGCSDDAMCWKLIGLVGRKGSGKDTAAQGLLEDRRWVKVSLAEPLRKVVKTMFLLTDEDCDDCDRKEQPGPLGVSYRRGMQAVGTELVRNQLQKVLPEIGTEGFWIQHMRRKVEQLWQEGKRVVITDVRFEDEADAIIELGGLLVFVDRPGMDKSDGHASETGVDVIVAKYRAPDMLVRLENNSTVDTLQTRLSDLVYGADALSS